MSGNWVKTVLEVLVLAMSLVSGVGLVLVSLGVHLS
jgi:hypothetical protein